MSQLKVIRYMRHWNNKLSASLGKATSSGIVGSHGGATQYVDLAVLRTDRC
jgi:hypothetical protein